MSNGQAETPSRWQAAEGTAENRGGAPERLTTRWVEETRRYRRPLGGWWWLALLLIPAVLALLGGAMSDDASAKTVTTSAGSTTSEATGSAASSGSASSGTSSAESSSSTGSVTNAACPNLATDVATALGTRTIQFGKNASDLPEPAKAGLTKVATLVKGCAGAHLTLEGYSDTSGDTASNQTYSQQRADAVKAYLVDQGLADSALTSVGKGETDKFGAGADAPVVNRCVQIVVG